MDRRFAPRLGKSTEPAIGSLATSKTENLRRLEEDQRERRCRFRALPDVVSFHTTEVCNLRCIMCVRHDVTGTRKLDRATLSSVCERLFPTARRSQVAADAGEPLLSDFDVILDAALRHGVVLDVITNGLPLTLARYREMRGALNHVNVSVDSHVPETYEFIREGARFAQLRANLEAIAAERRRVPDGVVWTMSAVVMRSNLLQLADFTRFARDMHMDGVVFQPLRQFSKRTPEEDPLSEAGAPDGTPRPSGRASPRTAGCPAPQERPSSRWPIVLAALDDARRTAQEIGINAYFSDFSLPSAEPVALHRKVGDDVDEAQLCWSVGGNFSLFWTGDVYACGYPTDHRFGNVLRQSIDEIWNGAAAQELRRAHFSRRGTLFCNGCLHAPYLPRRAAGGLPDLTRAARLAWRHVTGKVARTAAR